VRRERVVFGFHCRKLGLDIAYRRSESFHCILKARRLSHTPRRKSGSEPSSALNQVNNQDDERNYEQEMDQTAANVADEAKKPEND
jgi:hypothetical protein